MIKVFKYRIYPTDRQQMLIDKHIGATRLIYNLGLNIKHMSYFQYGKSISCKDLSAQLTDLKKELLWLNEINAQSLQYSLRKLDNAFTGFFNKRSAYPKFKSKRRSRQSCHFPQNNSINIEKSILKILKFPEGISIKFDRIPKGKIKSVCISKTPTNKYFASITFDTGELIPIKKQVSYDSATGIDLGLIDLVTLSNGTKIKNPRILINLQKRLAINQQRLTKKKKGSNRCKKQQLKINLIYEKIANKRNDFLHKISNQITNDYDTICMEDLNIEGMLKNHSLAKHISDASWNKLVEFLQYKSEWKGKNFVQIGRFEPSSKMCICGVINKNLKLGDREWVCSSCGASHDRDILAANNIKKIAFRNLDRLKHSGQDLPNENVELPTMVGAMKR